MKNILLTLFWVTLALLFFLLLHQCVGPTLAYEFLSGYLIEKSLSVDNLFVFSLIFSYLGIPLSQQSRYLTWGIAGAFLFRGILISLGAAIIHQFHWVLYGFGLFLIYSAIKLLLNNEEDTDLSTNPVIQWASARLPFFWVVVLAIETADIVFALDSIPATFAVTQNPLIVFSANVFAILGLRSLYMVLVDMLDRFEYLKYGVSLVLGFIGFKILMAHWLPIPTAHALVVTATLLIGSCCLSFIKTGDHSCSTN